MWLLEKSLCHWEIYFIIFFWFQFEKFFYFLAFTLKKRWGWGLDSYFTPMTELIRLKYWSIYEVNSSSGHRLDQNFQNHDPIRIHINNTRSSCGSSCDCGSYITSNIAPRIPNLNAGECQLESWYEQQQQKLSAICALLWSIYKINNLSLSTWIPTPGADAAASATV